MTLTVKNVEISVASSQDIEDYRRVIGKTLGVDIDQILGVRLVKKSLDARKKKNILFRLQFDFEARDEQTIIRNCGDLVSFTPNRQVPNPLMDLKISDDEISQPPVIVGTGPAGTFVAMMLALAGQRSIIIERGEKVESRIRTVNSLRQKGVFQSESNYCFGEGGAGTFSDGKLTCGRNHPLIRFVFEKLVEFGAPESIHYDAHPHIGTDNLLKVSKRMRQFLEAKGCEFHFGCRFEGFDYRHDQKQRFRLRLNGGSFLETNQLALAIGHSARDTFASLLDSKVAMVPKPFALGARIEHPQEIIDKIQFGSCQLLPPAEYKLAARAGSRGIWTFCMCPGGFLLPTGAQPGHLAINGMSYYARNSGFANAAIVVNVLKEDFYRGHPMDGFNYQANLEKLAFQAGGSDYRAPAQKVIDFMGKRRSKGDLVTTYKPGVIPARMDKILPEPVVAALKAALVEYSGKMKGFLNNDATIVGLESKTSSPVSLPRTAQLQSQSHPGLYPTGEGAGFAGGIVSAALDGVRVGLAILENGNR